MQIVPLADLSEGCRHDKWRESIAWGPASDCRLRGEIDDGLRIDWMTSKKPILGSLNVSRPKKWRTMQLSTRALAMTIAFTMIGTNAARGQDAIDRLRPLVETSARRLLIAEQVALAKWDSGAAVEDSPREAQVIRDVLRDSSSRGLDPISISNFFKAQIEANKIIQYSLLADWRRSGRAPAHAPMNLATTIRPELDRLQTALIAELADTVAIRASTTCRANVAKATGKYVLEHKHEAGPLKSIALDRALAASCTI
jgi:chorismate mutase